MKTRLMILTVLIVLVSIPMITSATTNIPVTGQIDAVFSCTVDAQYAQSALTGNIWHLTTGLNNQKWGRIYGSTPGAWSVSATMSSPSLIDQYANPLISHLQISTTNWAPASADVAGWSYSDSAAGSRSFDNDYTLHQVVGTESPGSYTGTIMFTCINNPSTAVCGNNICDGTETQASCPDDCGAAVCGNSVLESGETCDDGNTVGSDGCSAVCAVETGYICSNGYCENENYCNDGYCDTNEQFICPDDCR